MAKVTFEILEKVNEKELEKELNKIGKWEVKRDNNKLVLKRDFTFFDVTWEICYYKDRFDWKRVIRNKTPQIHYEVSIVRRIWRELEIQMVKELEEAFEKLSY